MHALRHPLARREAMAHARIGAMEILAPAEQIFFTTARLLSNMPRNEQAHGTAFFVGRAANERIDIYMATAGHVVAGAASGDAFFLPATPKGFTFGASVSARWTEPMWTFHPSFPEVDVAVLPFTRLNVDFEDVFIGMQPISEDVFLPKWQRTDNAMLEAIRRPQPFTEVTFVGYPGNYFDRTNGLPIARRGVTASPLSFDYEGHPLFLIDASVFPGSSGSPVLFVDERTNPLRFRLLGILTDTLPWKPLGWSPTDGIERPLINLGGVFKAHTVSEAIDTCVAG